MPAEGQGLLILTTVSVLSYIYQLESQISLGNAVINFVDGSLTITRKTAPDDVRTVLTGRLALEYPLTASPRKCAGEEMGGDEESVCVEWEDLARLRLNYATYDDGEVECYHIEWASVGEWNPRLPHDCIHTDGAHWYGGAEQYRDHWPLSDPVPLQPFVSMDVGLVNHSYGSVLDRYWLASSGAAILVEDDMPLLHSYNTSSMCYKADPHHPMYTNSKLAPQLSYTVCTANNIKNTHLFMLRKYFEKPSGLPDERMIRQPIWSTWAKYKMYIDQNKTLEYAEEIVQNGFPASQIEIDDKYTPAYGDFIFDPVKFPDPKAMIGELHKLDFRVISWVMPFATPDSAAFREGLNQGYFVMDNTGHVPGLIKWWQGFGAIVDFTNPEAVAWFTSRLKHLRTLGLDSFKYDAGEIGFLPPYFKFKTPQMHPNHYSRIYAEKMYAATNSFMEVRVGYKSQHLPVFVRMMDKDSQWNYHRGFDTMIPSALLFGLLGYPFVLPDMIGGNAYGDDGVTILGGNLPERELYIRWLTLNTFLPAMQFSICPWQYDQQVTDLAKNMVQLHEDYVTPRILEAGKESMQTGAPIIRPLWWLDPEDADTYSVDTQFMIGDGVLVAPIVEKGATRRDIYLPMGQWRDKLRGGLIEVTTRGHYLKDYVIDLEEIAYFERVS